MQISIVLVVHNHLPYVRGCIRRLIAHTGDHELLVVDNHSDRETVAFLKELEERGVVRHLILNEDNLGYAVACNQAVRLAAHSWIVMLHTDCLVTSGWVARLAAHTAIASDNLRLGAVIPTTNYANEDFPIYDDALKRRFIEYKLPNKSQPTEDDIEIVLRHTYPDGLDSFAASIRWRTPLVYSVDISSFCTMFSKAMFDECGLFDEGYSLRGYEDKDMYMRMRDRGFEVWCAKDCFVHHFGNITSDGEGFCFPEIMGSNRARFERVWMADEGGRDAGQA